MKKNKYQVGAIFSYSCTILNVLIGIFFTPFLLIRLGQSEFGLYQMIGSLAGYFIVFDFGLGTTITRYVAKYRAEQDIKKMQNFLAICIRIYLLISIFVLCVCTSLYFNINSIFFNLSHDQLNTARQMFLLLSLNISASLIFQSFTAIMMGYEKFMVDKLLFIARILLRCILITGLLLKGHHAISIVIVDTVLNVAFCLVRFLYCRFCLKVRFQFSFFDRKLTREIFGYSAVIFATYLIGMLNDQTDKLIVGITSGTTQVSICAVGMTLYNLFAQFGQTILSMLLPKATRIHIQEDGQAGNYAHIFTKTGRAQLLVLTAVIIGFTMFGQQFVVLWVGREYQMSYWVALVMMWVYFIPYTSGAFAQVLTAQSKLKGLTLIFAISAVLNVLISIPLAYRFGAVGSAVGTGIMVVCCDNIAAHIYFSKVLKVKLRSYFKSIFKGFWITTIISFAFGACLNVVGGNGWGGLIWKLTAYLGIYAACTWFVSLNHNEKHNALSLLRPLMLSSRGDMKRK